MDTTDAAGRALADGPTPAYFSGVVDEARLRLLELGVLVPVEDPDDADLFVLSTRLRRNEVSSEIARAKAGRTPIVVLAHTGGEAAAVEMMRGGGAVVIAEGNEMTLLSYLTGGANDTGMLETYERRIGSASSSSSADGSIDPATGLPASAAFEERLEHLNQSGEVPRLAFLRVMNLDAGLRMSADAVALLRRRLGLQYLALARMVGAELFALKDNEFALLAAGLTPEKADELARRMARVTESFAPSGAQPLTLAVGHAGAEVATEMATLRELASRACAVASEAPASRAVGADSLSLGLAATTELEAALRIIEVIERSGAHEPGHGARVAALAHELARQLGFDPTERTQIRLAAHLADIGKIGLPAETLGDPRDMDADAQSLYREHPTRGADYIRTSAGELVADAIAHHHEHWDGSGFPSGAAGTDIPVIARIIAVAGTYESLVNHADPARRSSPEDALAYLSTQAGVTLDPAIVEIAIAALADRQRLVAAAG